MERPSLTAMSLSPNTGPPFRATLPYFAPHSAHRRSGSGCGAEAPRPKGDRRLELPFSFTVAA